MSKAIFYLGQKLDIHIDGEYKKYLITGAGNTLAGGTEIHIRNCSGDDMPRDISIVAPKQKRKIFNVTKIKPQ